MDGIRIAGNLFPVTPTIESFPTFPLRRRSNIVRPTTPTFLSDPEAPPPTKPVVYSPVPTMRTSRRGFSAVMMKVLLSCCVVVRLSEFTPHPVSMDLVVREEQVTMLEENILNG